MGRSSKVRKAKGGGCLLAGFFGVFAAAGGAAFYFLTWRPIAGLVAAQGWVETECAITSSRVDESRSSEGTTYRVDVRYTYEVDWQTYEGDRYDFSVGYSSGYDGKARVVAAHPPGSETACYYDPEAPRRSVIDRSPGLYLLWGLFPLPFLAVGVGGLVYLLTPAGRRRASRAARRGGRAGAARPAAVHGPLELEARHSPVLKVAGTLVFAAFWNGMVALVVLGQILPGWRRGDVDGCLVAFMIPFALVGLFALAFFAYQLLAAFNPRPRLTLAEGHLTPGAGTTLAWRFSGRAGRLEKLTIALEGREKAVYRRGTKTYTDHHVFYSRELVSEAGRFGAVHRGTAALAVPERTMPTFDAGNNEIEWRLTVHGDVPFWPDVDDEFPITVYPGEGR